MGYEVSKLWLCDGGWASRVERLADSLDTQAVLLAGINSEGKREKNRLADVKSYLSIASSSSSRWIRREHRIRLALASASALARQRLLMSLKRTIVPNLCLHFFCCTQQIMSEPLISYYLKKGYILSDEVWTLRIEPMTQCSTSWFTGE